MAFFTLDDFNLIDEVKLPNYTEKRKMHRFVDSITEGLRILTNNERR